MHTLRDRSFNSRQSKLALFAIVTIATVALAGCASGQTTSTTSAAKSSIVVLDPDQSTQMSIDAGFDGSLSDFEDVTLTNATLIAKPYVSSPEAGVVDQDISKFQGVLAKSYSVNASGLVYTFHLKHGVISQRGDELTSDDVLWSFDRKFGSPTSIVPYVVDAVITNPEKQFAKIDKYDFSITVTSAGEGFTLLAVLADFAGDIYDSTYLKKHATKADPWATAWSKNKFNYGFGAYDVTSVQPGTSLTLSADPHYVLGVPKIKTIVRRVVTDPAVRASTLAKGDANVANDLLPAQMAVLAKNKKVFAPDVAANDFALMSLVNNKKPFNNVNVRRAFAYAINYDEIVKQVYRGRATKTNTFLPSNTAGYDGTGLPDWSYDPVKSKAMLAAAGSPNGIAFTLTISSADSAMQAAATQIQTSAASAGFKITIQKLSTAAFTTGFTTGKLQAFLKTDEAVTLSPSYELGVWTTPGSSADYSQYDSKPFQAAVKAGEAAGDATSTAAGIQWNKAERIWLGQDVANIFIAKIAPTVALSSNLTGWTNRTDNNTDYSVMSFTK
jgi:peptide/nickel transport system substrate-binding protein